MTPLPESFRAFMYQSGIDRIADAYRASIATMEASRQRAYEAQRSYRESGEDDSEYDQDDALVRSTAFELDNEWLDATLALSIVNQAFITSAFHYWEHFARAYTQRTESRDDFKTLCTKLTRRYQVSKYLPIVNLLNNLIKHNRGGLALDLVMEWPEIFTRHPFCVVETQQMVWSIILTSNHVETVLQIIRDSGPRMRS